MTKEKGPLFQELYDGFENSKLSKIWSHARFEEKSIEIQNKIVRKGKRALKITIHEGDKAEKNKNNKISERDELLEEKKFSSYEDESYNYSFSIYLPNNFPIVSTRLVLAQWKQSDENNDVLIDNPILALRYVNGELFITLQISEERKTLFITKEEIRGRWIDFNFKVRFTRTTEGFVKVWFNKNQIVDYTGITAYSKKYNYPEQGNFYFKMGLYRDKMYESMTIYIDEFKKKHLRGND